MSFGAAAYAQEDKQEVDGKYFDKEEEPTYNVKEDGTVDWYTYSGFRRYHSECHVCHGPDGLGSTYAPALAETMKTMGYADFIGVVASGKERITSSETSKMPAFGDNVNVYCYMDDIYVYLKARADEAIPRGRPKKRDKKPEQATTYENECREGT
ncbi:MAG: c-type cytochrome, methanol metabolism-related [Rhizobiales bacterium]|nr:c-type cytochrome, methanol metabolism-related [Hyphomicrobiales bacterium]